MLKVGDFFFTVLFGVTYSEPNYDSLFKIMWHLIIMGILFKHPTNENISAFAKTQNGNFAKLLIHCVSELT